MVNATECQVPYFPSKRSRSQSRPECKEMRSRSQSRPECESLPPRKILSLSNSMTNLFLSSTKPRLANPNRKRKSKSNKRVRFHDDSKTWDGPRREHVLLERLVKDFWGAAHKLTVIDELVDEDDDEMLLKLENLLRATIKRVEQSASNRGAYLLRSGGKHVIRLKPSNIAGAKMLLAHIEDAHNSAWLLKMLTLWSSFWNAVLLVLWRCGTKIRTKRIQVIRHVILLGA